MPTSELNAPALAATPHAMTQHHDSILIIDFGSQVTQLIARRVREIGVYCEIAPFQSASEAFQRIKPKGVIFSGGPASVPDEGSPRAPEAVFSSGLPVLGIYADAVTLIPQVLMGIAAIWWWRKSLVVPPRATPVAT